MNNSSGVGGETGATICPVLS